MKRSFATATLFACVYASSALAVEPSDAGTCQSTNPQGGWLGSDSLRVSTPGGGRIVLRPGGPGFVTKDGALGWKFLWGRNSEGTLHVEGRRIDADAPPLRVELAPPTNEAQFQPSYLIFPQPGCWQVTGRLGTNVVSFVIAVERVQGGPDWQRG